MAKDDFYNEEKLYSIGEVANRVNVSTRTLRYYEKIGLISPDLKKDNGYRYYKYKTIIVIPIIKYLQFMDFSLDEIKEFLSYSDYEDIYQVLTNSVNKTKEEMDRMSERLTIVNDWASLINEAGIARAIRNIEPSIKYIQGFSCIKYKKDFNFSYDESILDVDFANFVQERFNKVTGPVMHYFENFYKRLQSEENGEKTEVIYIQRTVGKPLRDDCVFIYEGGFVASIYHFGCHSDLKFSYKKIIDWAKNKNVKLKNSSIERFVSDQWSLTDVSKFVTEILIPLER